MNDHYPVWIRDKQSGNVEIRKIGLFYEIFCQCSLPDDRIYKLYAKSSAGLQHLGIPAPEKNTYAVRTKIQIGKMELKDIRFFLRPINEKFEQTLLPIYPNKPFEYLSSLEEASCVVHNEAVYLALNGSHSACGK